MGNGAKEVRVVDRMEYGATYVDLDFLNRIKMKYIYIVLLGDVTPSPCFMFG